MPGTARLGIYPAQAAKTVMENAYDYALHGDQRLLKVLMRFFTIVRPNGFRVLLWPGTNRSARAGSGPASRGNVRFVSMAA